MPCGPWAPVAPGVPGSPLSPLRPLRAGRPRGALRPGVALDALRAGRPLDALRARRPGGPLHRPDVVPGVAVPDVQVAVGLDGVGVPVGVAGGREVAHGGHLAEHVDARPGWPLLPLRPLGALRAGGTGGAVRAVLASGREQRPGCLPGRTEQDHGETVDPVEVGARLGGAVPKVAPPGHVVTDQFRPLVDDDVGGRHLVHDQPVFDAGVERHRLVEFDPLVGADGAAALPLDAHAGDVDRGGDPHPAPDPARPRRRHVQRVDGRVPVNGDGRGDRLRRAQRQGRGSGERSDHIIRRVFGGVYAGRGEHGDPTRLVPGHQVVGLVRHQRRPRPEHVQSRGAWGAGRPVRSVRAVGPVRSGWPLDTLRSGGARCAWCPRRPVLTVRTDQSQVLPRDARPHPHRVRHQPSPHFSPR